MARSARKVTLNPRPPRPRVAVVVSRYNDGITSRLLEGAVGECRARSVAETVVYEAPGSFEVPAIAMAAAKSGRFDAVVALGCIIKGETSHDRHLGAAVTAALLEVSLKTGVSVGLGVLTVDNVEQAAARAGGSLGNKGTEAAGAALDALSSIIAARSGEAARQAGERRPRPDKTRGRAGA